MKARLYKYMYITIAAASMFLGCLVALKIRTSIISHCDFRVLSIKPELGHLGLWQTVPENAASDRGQHCLLKLQEVKGRIKPFSQPTFSHNRPTSVISTLIHSPLVSQLYEGESISNQPNLFAMDRDGHDFHALFQYMFYTWVQNCTRIESFFNKILNVKHG